VTLVELLKKHEGLRLTPYLCPAGYLTIGYGHRCERESGEISRDEAEVLLLGDMAEARKSVRALVEVDLMRHQEDALVSFTFNLGASRLKDSTLLKLVNLKRFADVPAQLRRWVYAGGKEMPGLIARREDEARMFAGFGNDQTA